MKKTSLISGHMYIIMHYEEITRRQNFLAATEKIVLEDSMNKKLFQYIKQAYPDAINRYTELFDDLMEIDIYIPSKKTAIEYDGTLWHSRKRAEK